MLTPAVHEAIGRFTVAFNEIEFFIEVYIANILDTPEWDISYWLAQRESGFDRKTKLLKNLLDMVAKEHPKLTPQIDSISVSLTRAAEIATKRNEHVHGLAVEQPLTKAMVRRHKGVEKPYDLSEINGLANETSELAGTFNLQCGVMVAELVHLRDLKRAEQDLADSL